MTVRNWLPRLALAAVMASTVVRSLEASAAERSVRPHRTPAAAPAARRAERQPKRTSPERSSTAAAERESDATKSKPPAGAKAAESSSEPWVAIYPVEK